VGVGVGVGAGCSGIGELTQAVSSSVGTTWVGRAGQPVGDDPSWATSAHEQLIGNHRV
jgi:hypothetical protein